jgi:tRNA modification GTPase
MTDTITALATPPGNGGISVIRLSGPESTEIADKVVKGNTSLLNVSTHTIHYGSIVDADLLIDQVTAAVFLNPQSYTGEDVVEISCHGGPLIVSQIINLLEKSGARLR